MWCWLDEANTSRRLSRPQTFRVDGFPFREAAFPPAMPTSGSPGPAPMSQERGGSLSATSVGLRPHTNHTTLFPEVGVILLSRTLTPPPLHPHAHAPYLLMRTVPGVAGSHSTRSCGTGGARIKGCLQFTHERAQPGAVAPHGADILSDARCPPGAGALNGTGAPGADARCPTRRRRPAHALSLPAACKHACSHIHTHRRACAVSIQTDLQARHDGCGPGSVPSGNRDRQGLCSSESSPSLPAGCTAPAGGEPES